MNVFPGFRLFAVLCLLTGGLGRAAEIRIDYARDSDPQLKLSPAPRLVFTPELKPLWLGALRRSEADMQRQAADAIARAHQAGFPDLIDVRPRLADILNAADSHPAARFAAARALIALDTRASGRELFEAAEKHGSQLRLLVEPALAAWDYEPAHETWLKRLRDPACPLRELLLAAECLGRVRESAAVEPLLGIVHDPLRPGDVRLAAARAAGAIRDAGLETDAVRLNATGSAAILPRLCAVALLQRHGSSAAQDQLLQLARDDEPAVIAAAMGRLLEIDPALVLPLAEQALQNRDANVRQRGVDAYVALPTPERVASLAARLDDVHPGIRGHVRDALFRLAERAELDMPIRQGAMRVLHDESWRGQEQAALLLGALDHKPAAARFVALLDAPRPEVMETVAWGLRKLAVPETVPAIFERVSHLTEYRLRSDISPPPRLDQQVAHLCEALGVLRHQSAEPLMRRYVAKNYRMGEASRCAAIWTLGHLHAGTPDEALAKELMQRVTDTNPLQPEYISVQRMSAVSLGRMKAVSQAAALREWLGAEADKGIGDPAFMWAVTQLTGETFPEPEPPTIGMSGWFLEPLPKLSPPTPAP